MYNIQEDITNSYYLTCFQWSPYALQPGLRVLWHEPRVNPAETSQ